MRRRLLFFALVAVILTALSLLLLHGNNIAVLNPQGTIADQQRDLIVFTVLLSMVVIIPVFVLLFFISWKYRAGNKSAKYTPDNDGNKWLELIWWGIPCIIILILSIVTWRTSHDLDPYKELSSSVEPVTIEVVALQWKWLFIYPDQDIATVNFVQFPEKTPINFKLTADAPMNSFWIPSLGGQVYAMSGMTTQLHLMADGVGSYDGSSANISGEGFADMKFVAHSSTSKDFEQWAKAIKSNSADLSMDEYNELIKPDRVDAPKYYSLSKPGLYDTIVMKYMGSGHVDDDAQADQDSPSMDHDMSGHATMESMPGMEGME